MIQLSESIIQQLSSRGVLAYVAVNVAGCGTWTTAGLASIVHCTTNSMRDGMNELSVYQPEVVEWVKKDRRWFVGGAENPVGALEEHTERRKVFIDDLKKYWDHLNPNLPFAMGPQDGMAIGNFLRKHQGWTQDDWRRALNYRARSEGLVRTQPIFVWLGRLGEYAAGPLDRYGKAMEGGIGGAHGKAISIEERNRAARQSFTAGQNRVG